MELVDYTDDDLALTVALESDPRVMAELGGPRDAGAIADVHRRRADGVADGSNWWFKIVPEPGGPAAGTIGVWDSDWEGGAVAEVGWMVLPELQGRGIASEALRLLIARARAEPRWGDLHAFPGETNPPSNALCRKFGFELIERCEVEFAGRPLRVNHWVLALASGPS